MAVMGIPKIAVWVVGGLFLAGVAGMLALYGAAGLAMWGNAKAMEKEQAAREAALDAKDFPTCRHHMMYVPRETPSAESLRERAHREEDAWDLAQDAARASNPTKEVSR
jgi:hypothetical protein